MPYKRTIIDDSSDERKKIERHIASNISSSASGKSWVGEDVANKRANLIHAQGEPQVGRRPSPEPYDPRPRRLMYLRGILAGLAVVVIVLVIVFFLGSGSSLG